MLRAKVTLHDAWLLLWEKTIRLIIFVFVGAKQMIYKRLVGCIGWRIEWNRHSNLEEGVLKAFSGSGAASGVVVKHVTD